MCLSAWQHVCFSWYVDWTSGFNGFMPEVQTDMFVTHQHSTGGGGGEEW